VSVFDAKSLEATVQATLQAEHIPEHHRHAFVLVATSTGGGAVKGVVATKISDTWQLDTYVSVGRTMPLEAGAVFKGSW
jgi:hypothetical protein